MWFKRWGKFYSTFSATTHRSWYFAKTMDEEQSEPPSYPGLRAVTLEQQDTFQSAFNNLSQPIAEYSFANIFIWNTALKLYWKKIHSHICIFANGNDLTLAVPPIPELGATNKDLLLAIAESFDIMDTYNKGSVLSRIEYVSDETLERIQESCSSLNLSAQTLHGDYIYPRENMITLSGGSLKSKRQLKSRFIREHPEAYTTKLTDEQIPACLELLNLWKESADESHEGQITEDGRDISTKSLRNREYNACEVSLKLYKELKLQGMTVHCDNRIIGFTLGEQISPLQASILVEKTHPDYNGCPQFIFSEFCKIWTDCPEINVGDDWGIPTLRWTKESYKPSRRLNKYVLNLEKIKFSQKKEELPIFAGK